MIKKYLFLVLSLISTSCFATETLWQGIQIRANGYLARSLELSSYWGGDPISIYRGINDLGIALYKDKLKVSFQLPHSYEIQPERNEQYYTNTIALEYRPGEKTFISSSFSKDYSTKLYQVILGWRQSPRFSFSTDYRQLFEDYSRTQDLNLHLTLSTSPKNRLVLALYNSIAKKQNFEDYYRLAAGAKWEYRPNLKYNLAASISNDMRPLSTTALNIYAKLAEKKYYASVSCNYREIRSEFYDYTTQLQLGNRKFLLAYQHNWHYNFSKLDSIAFIIIFLDNIHLQHVVSKVVSKKDTHPSLITQYRSSTSLRTNRSLGHNLRIGGQLIRDQYHLPMKDSSTRLETSLEYRF